jgi:OHCU decarboxylase
MPDAAPLAFSIDMLNRASPGQAAAMMDRIVERSAWLAHRAAQARPFADAGALADWLDAQVRGLSRAEAVELLCAHPELSPPDPEAMSAASRTEQDRLRLLDGGTEVSARLADLNRRYLRRHGFPFVIALHAETDLDGVLARFERSIAADPEEELARALGAVISVMRARLARLVASDKVTS